MYLRVLSAQMWVPLFVVLAFWSAAIGLFDPGEVLFPGPWTTLKVWWVEAKIWLPHAWATARVLLLSLGLGLLLAFPFALAMVRSARFRAAMETLFLILQCVPLFVVTPVLITISGWGLSAVLVPSVLATLLPLCTGLYKGLLTVPTLYLELYSTYEMGPWAHFWTIRFPFALPALTAGLRVAIATGGSTVLAAEFAGGQEGLGMLLQESRRNFDLAMVFSSIVTVGILIGGLIGLLKWGESCSLRGHSDVALS